ncbi:MAG: trigger factor family protein [Rikenellaceae bacterium]|jgi:hypothetical protein|nr:trigger factor family protein [Rikenellaceae bacterium]
MNITTEQKPGGTLVLTATVDGADYAPEVDKRLKEYRRSANVPGFRPGMVPMGVINKMYRRGVVAEQAYRKASEAAYKYLEDNKIDYIGDPIAGDEQGEFDFEGDTQHAFVFEVGVAPAVNLTLDDSDKLTYYKIKIDKGMRDSWHSNFMRRFGQTDENKVAIDEEFFKTAFPDGSVTDEAGLAKFGDGQIEAELARESEYLFTVQLRDYLLKKANLAMPEDFLRRWLFVVNEGKFTAEEIDKDFPAFLKMMAWSRIQNYFIDTLGLKIEQEDMIAEAKNIARMQFAQYGMSGVPDDTLTGFAQSILSNKEEAQRIFEQVRQQKVIDAVKGSIKTTNKSVSAEEFQKVASSLA